MASLPLSPRPPRPLPSPPPHSPSLSPSPSHSHSHTPSSPHSPSSHTPTTHHRSSSSTATTTQAGIVPLAAAAAGGALNPNASTPGSGEEGAPLISCNGCHKGLEETGDSVVVSFGNSLWHVDCFRCAKCHSLVEHDTNLLLLSDGSPVCENCSYICSVCKKAISNEAIVTGDESYHADCFRCKSCSLKIEELIFAKTSAGIWCMSCHNERVSRSRKHAESKRTKSIRSGSGRKSSRDKSGLISGSGESTPGTAKSSQSFAVMGSHAEGVEEEEESGAKSAPIIRLGDTPFPSTPPSIAPSSPSTIRPSKMSPTSSTFASSLRSEKERERARLDSEASTSSLAVVIGAEEDDTSTSITSTGMTTPLVGSPSSTSLFPSSSGTSTPTSMAVSSSLNPSISTSSILSAASSLTSNSSATSQTRSLSPTFSTTTTSSSLLSAPKPESIESGRNKSANRRSGFYGSLMGAAAGGLAGLGGGSGNPEKMDKLTEEDSTGVVVGGVREDSLGSTKEVKEDDKSAPSYLPELHNSMSFYDPDTLLFLNHVASNNPSTPTTAEAVVVVSDADAESPTKRKKKVGILDDEGLGMGDEDVRAEERETDESHSEADETVEGYGEEADGEEKEHLSPDLTADSNGQFGLRLGAGGASTGRRGGSEDGEAVEIERKVRESIRQSRVAEGKGVGLEIELVELLLEELEKTKGEMKAVLGKYNAFRRASRSAFEGFSQAREEYDKEVAARREVESAMDELRTTFTEQALRLAAFDKDEKLKRKSRDLRVSVSGMERHLSSLKAEVELETAQMEELKSGAKSEKGEKEEVPQLLSAPSPAELERSLTVRLESVKDAHRREIEALIQERDALAREIVELAQTRDLFKEETVTLGKRKEALQDANEEAGRQLENAKEVINKLRSPGYHPSALTAAATGHRQSPSVSSTGSQGLNGRSPLGFGARSAVAASTNTGSASPDLDNGKTEWIATTTTAEHPPPAAVKKFKWGKSTKHEIAKPAPSSLNSNGNLPTMLGPNSSSSSASIVSSSGSMTLVNGSSGHGHAHGHHSGANGSGSKSASPMGRGNGSSTERAHTFQQTSILRPVRCEYCGDKMWGLNEVRCTGCGCYSHAKCAGYLQSSCGQPSLLHGQDDTLNLSQNGQGIFGNDLTAQARSEDRQVPIAVSKCIAAVESHGMNYEGIYRKTGGMTQTKLITQCFERGTDFDLDDLDRFNDLAAVTSCMKNYFRSLPDPLFTHDLHEQFVSCAEMPDGEGRFVALETALYKLPEAHFYTARALLAHLHRVHLRSSENKMTPANLGVVFGPTVLRSRHASREFSDMGFKAKLVELMVEQYPRLFTKPYTPPLAEE